MSGNASAGLVHDVPVLAGTITDARNFLGVRGVAGIGLVGPHRDRDYIGVDHCFAL